MAGSVNFKSGLITLKALGSAPSSSVKGDFYVDTSDGLLVSHNGTSFVKLVTLVTVQTLTNKTFNTPHITNPSGLTKTNVGLSNVENIPDLLKVISTATQTALNNTQDLDSDLTTIAGLTLTENGVLQRKLNNWSIQSPDSLKPELDLTRSDLDLDLIDNTSDATKNAAEVNLTNKTLVEPIIDNFLDLDNLLGTLDDASLLNTLGGQPSAQMAVTPNDVYITVASTQSPGQTQLRVYKRNKNVLTQINTYHIDDWLNLALNKIDISVDSRYIVAGGTKNSLPYLIICELENDIVTRLTDVDTLPSGFISQIKFSPDNNFLAVTHSTTPYITIYQRSGATFTKLADPVDLPPNNSLSVAWSVNSEFLAVGHNDSPYLTIYQVSGTTFTKLDGVSGEFSTNLPTDRVLSLSFSESTSNGLYLAVGQSTNPYIWIYSISGTTFTRRSSPSDLPNGPVNEVNFVSNYVDATNPLLLVAHDNAPYHIIYEYADIDPRFWSIISPLNLTRNCRQLKSNISLKYLYITDGVSPFTFNIFKTNDRSQPAPDSGKVRLYKKNESLYYKDSDGLESSIFTASIRDEIKVTFKSLYDYSEVKSIGDAQFPWSSPQKIDNPLSLPNSVIRGCSFSPNGEFLAITNAGSGAFHQVNVYQRSGDTFTKLPDLTDLAGSGRICAFSSNGEFLAASHNNSPYITIYQRSGATFTKLADPVDLPTGTAWGCAFSPNGEFLAVAHSTTPYITIYQRSGTTFTKLADPVDLPPNVARRCTFSPNGEFLAVTHGNEPYVTVYQRSGNTFVKVPDLPLSTGTSAFGCSFSPNGEFLAMGHSVAPYITIYQRSGTTFIKLADPLVLPTGLTTGCEFSPNGEFLAVTYEDSPFIIIYQRSGTTFTKLADPVDLPTDLGQVITWAPNGDFLVVGHNFSTRSLTIYQTNSDQPRSGVLKLKGVERSPIT
jgi:6-phosphogluconolactonase (cycloisomerase 2 family)